MKDTVKHYSPLPTGRSGCSEGIFKKATPMAILAFALVAALSLCVWGCSSPSQSQNSPSSSNQESASSSTETSSDSESHSPSVQDMTIHVQMKEAATSPEAPDSPDQFAEENINVVAPQGATALEVLKATGREVGTEAVDGGEQVISIGALINGDAGETSRWIYQVNGEDQTVPPSACGLKDGDTLTFTFVK